ncbi:hypothetical protein MYX77_07465 [Acidobacteriia bacterium AH_259_A11_L15]|nr:hypothetical protein [Acidobacteriia bacterium AH_259_A11_L15]
MRRWVGLALAALVAFSLPAVAAAQEPVPLPVRKVVLFKNGMGYFEHLGEVRGAQVVEIVLPSSQLNDVLKSLTVIDLGRGQIAGVTYDSAAPLARRLAELPIDLRSVRGLVDFLNAIRGTEVEIRAPGGTIAGRLMGAELRARSINQTTTQVVEVSVFTPGGEVRIVDLESAGGLRVTQESLAGDITRYLGLLGSAHERDLRRLRIQTVGRGRRQLYVSYTSEVPIWKTTYRIVLDEGQSPLLQGWAVVDNTTPLDWLDVELSLVAGAPVSFVYNLSQPIYARRPVVPLPEGVLVSPQTHEATLEEQEAAVGGALALRAESDEMRRSRERAASLAPPEAKSAPGMVPGRIGEMVRQQPIQAAQAQALGEQFEYRIRQPVSIRRNQSALLPILHTDVKGEKVSVFNDSRGDLRPRLGFWLENSTELTLDAGSFTVIDSNAFAGEGLTQTINPGERRLLSYALDLGLEVATNRGTERVRVERVEIHRGVLRFHRRVVEKKTYTVRNNDAKPRSVILEHPVRAGWELIDTAEPVESSASFHRFRVEVKPKQTVEFAVREENPQQTTYALTNITPEQITLWVRQKAIDREIEQALQRIVAKKNEINALNQQIQALEQEQNEIFRDQERVRNNLARLGRTPEEANLRLRYIRQLEQQENRLGALRAERARLEDARAAAQKQLDQMLQNLSFDRKL